MPFKKNQHPASSFEHYAVYLALVISLLASFLLGMVLSDTLLGTGFTYFSQMRDQINFQKAHASQLGGYQR